MMRCKNFEAGAVGRIGWTIVRVQKLRVNNNENHVIGNCPVMSGVFSLMKCSTYIVSMRVDG